MLMHVSEAWTLHPKAIESMKGWNSRHLLIITRHSFREEAVTPSFDLVRAIRQRLHRWLGHVLRMPEDRLIKQTVSYIGSAGPPYEQGSVMMDCKSKTFGNIIKLAADQRAWELSVQQIDSLHESLIGAEL